MMYIHVESWEIILQQLIYALILPKVLNKGITRGIIRRKFAVI